MPQTIISDTSCLILFDKIGEMDILRRLFGKITTTTEVAEEFGQPLPFWLTVQQPLNKNYQVIFETLVDKGEASAIALAVESKDCLLIIDDLKGRKFAQQLGIAIIGSLGIIMEAKNAGIISSVQSVLSKIKATNFRLSKKLELLILKRMNE